MTQKPAKPATKRSARRLPQTRAKRPAITSAQSAKRAPAAPAVARPEPSAGHRAWVCLRRADARPVTTRSLRAAYFIALEEGGGDEVTNWLRAERELATA